MQKTAAIQDVMAKIADGQTIMLGGFGEAGYPYDFIEALADRGVRGLTVISNDAGTAAMPKGTLIRKMLAQKGMVKKYIVSHIGLNQEMAQRMEAGEFEIEFIPMGTFAERIRCGGSGLGGVLTPTGIGTVIAEGKKVIEVDGKSYLLETPLHADVALVKAFKADTSGNLVFRRAARSFNPLMATAADFVAAEADVVVDVGEIDPDDVHIPGLFVDMVVRSQHC